MKFLPLFLCLLPFIHADQNPCHVNGKRKAGTCRKVTLPTGLCRACGVGAPLDNYGNYTDCTRTSGLEDIFGNTNEQCWDLLQDYVDMNECDAARKKAVEFYNLTDDAVTKEKGRQRLDFFIYAICEEACDCIPQVDTDPHVKSLDVTRGNAQGHAYWDICAIFPNIQLIRGEGTPDQDLPSVCPMIIDWYENSGDGQNFMHVPHTPVDPNVEIFLNRLVEATGLLDPMDDTLWDQCINLESTQGRINLTAPVLTSIPSGQPSMAPSTDAPSASPLESTAPSSAPQASTYCTNDNTWRDTGCDVSNHPSEKVCVKYDGTEPAVRENGDMCVSCVNHKDMHGQDRGCGVSAPFCIKADGSSADLYQAGVACATSATDIAKCINTNGLWRDTGCTASLHGNDKVCAKFDNTQPGPGEEGDKCVFCINHADGEGRDTGCPGALPYCVKADGSHADLDMAGVMCVAQVIDVTDPPTTEQPSTVPSMEPSSEPSAQPSIAPSSHPSPEPMFPFETGSVMNIYGPTAIAFGPDGKMYVGTMAGGVFKLTLDENYNISSSVVSYAVANTTPGENRVVTSIAFDPHGATENPTVYVSHSYLFHESNASFTGSAINGKISALSGANLDVLTDVVTGLPVSDSYHGVNSLLFDDGGNLLIQVGGNTNAGVPGPLADMQPDNVLGAATLLAKLSDPNFNGTLEYDSTGQLKAGSGIEIFASGERNSFDIVLHSSGKLYATDSGPKNGYGNESTSCNTVDVDPAEPDKLNLVTQGGFYGHANRARGECTWRSATEPSDTSYLAPLGQLPSDTSGLVEFEAGHFFGQLRGNLILSQYAGSLYRIVLNDQGDSVVAGPSMLLPGGGFDLSHGPDGTIFVAQLAENAIIYHKPLEQAAPSLVVRSVFPRRGSTDGGNKLTVYGEHLVGISDTIVSVGGENCPLVSSSFQRVECTLPQGTGIVDVQVTVDSATTTFEKSYRYVVRTEAHPASPSPSAFPTESPSARPSMSPTDSPSTRPSSEPSSFPSDSSAPSVSPSTNHPSSEPSRSASPSSPPSNSGSPTSSYAPSSSPTPFKHEEIFISAGELDENYTDLTGALWLTDSYYNEGTFDNAITRFIRRTDDDTLYKSWREGPYINYNIPVVSGDYFVTLHFSENNYESDGWRLFDILIEGKAVKYGFDPYKDIGWDRRAYSFTSVVTEVLDGTLNIELVAQFGNAIINAIEVERAGPHLAHSVPGGPYTAVDTDGDGFASVTVDAALSHTHALGRQLVTFSWMLGGSEIATGEKTTLNLPVGQHVINLKVIDDGGNDSDDFTEVSVLPEGYPALDLLSPSSGDWTGGEVLTLTGSGFNYTADEIVVKMGTTELTGPAEITVVNETTIVVLYTPAFAIAAPEEVKVVTPIGTSNIRFYTNVAEIPITFEKGSVADITGASCLTFGPDGKLYVGTLGGSVYKLTLDEKYEVLESVISNKVAASAPQYTYRVILGIAFDPFDSSEHPAVYVTHSSLFHNSTESFLGASVNAKVSTLSGANLDVIEDIVTGLPVSDHDHAVNGIMFDDQGDLYIQIGGNTNAGVPGQLTASGIQKENVLSAATIVARLSDPNFNGTIEYDENGQLKPGAGVEIFATGQRNSFGIMLHSNGNIYATDNGPNTGYGAQSTSCSTSSSDPNEPDKLNLLVQGGYYGHANRARGECVWRSGFDPSDSAFTAPLAHFPSSTDGIIEFESNHFGGHLRGNLIAGQYGGRLFRVVLDETGQIVFHGPSTLLVDGGLDLTQGPDGTLFIAQLVNDKIIFQKPKEPALTTVTVKSVFPRRGNVDGGSSLSVFGENFSENSTVAVGGQSCNVSYFTSSRIECMLPSGFGPADVVVTDGNATSILTKAYRFIRQPRWETLTTTFGPRKRHEACFVMASNDKGYLIGGRGDKPTTEFDPATNTWIRKSKAPILLHHMNCVAADDRIWIVSAWTGNYPYENNTDFIYVYNFTDDTWDTRAGLPEDRRRGGAATIYVEREGKREIYVSHGNRGGHGSHAQALGWLDKYDIDSDTWTTNLTDAPNPRDHTGGSLMNGANKFCIAAGRDGGQDDFFNTVVLPTDCYNLETGEWEVKAPIPQGRAGSAYGTTCDGKLMVAGGEGFGQAWSNVDIFDGEVWQSLDDLNTARHGTGLAFDCQCNEIFITSGSGDQGGTPELSTTERYRPKGSTCWP